MAARQTRKTDSYDRYIGGTGYSYTSHAIKPEMPGRSGEPRRAKPRAGQPPKRRTVVRGKKKVRRGTLKPPPYSIEISAKTKGGFMRSFIFAVVFFGAFLCVFSMAYIEYRKMELSKLQSELERLKKDNIILKGEIMNSYDLVEVNRYATSVLDMVKPDESQIVYIDAEKISYMEQYDVTEDDIGIFSILSGIFDTLKSLIWTEKK